MPLLIVLVIVVVVVVGSRLLGRRNRPDQRRPAQGAETSAGADTGISKDSESLRPQKRSEGAGQRSRKTREITREDAAEASARLSPEVHRRVYALIAQRQVMNAVREYRKATKLGLGEAAAAVAALAQFPQPTPDAHEASTPSNSSNVAGAGERPSPAPVEPTPRSFDGPLTVEDIVNAGGAGGDTTQKPAKNSEKPVVNPVTAGNGYRYRAIVSQGGDIREVASTRLNEGIFQNIKELARSGDTEAAAEVLRQHSDISTGDAREFVAMIDPED